MAPHIIYLGSTHNLSTVNQASSLAQGGEKQQQQKPLFWVSDQFVSSVKLCPFSKHTLGSNKIRFQG